MIQRIMFTFVLIISILGGISVSHAGDENYTKNYNYYTPDYEPKLEYNVNGDSVSFEWNKASSEEFRYYKLVHSFNNSTPSYPKDQTVFVGKSGQERTTTKYRQGYWRVCHVHKGFYENSEDTKYSACSNSVYLKKREGIISTSNEQKKKLVNYVKTKKEASIKKETTAKKETKTINKNEVSTSLQKRADAIVTNFKKRLDNSSLSNEVKAQKIDSIISKLASIKKSKPRLAMIIGYLIEKLEDLKSDYDDGFDDIEELFNF